MVPKNINDPDIIDKYVEIQQRSLPTAETIHREIGLSWEVIAKTVFFCSRNTVEKYSYCLPKQFYTAKPEEAVQKVLAIWENAIQDYIKSIPHQEKRASEVRERWNEERPKYERALQFEILLRPNDEEIKYMDSSLGISFDAETEPYDPALIAYDTIAIENKEKLLERMKPILEKLLVEQIAKLANYYDGYTNLVSLPFWSCVGIMAEPGRKKLKEKMDGMSGGVQEHMYRALSQVKTLMDCQGIRESNTAQLRGGLKSVWGKFERKTMCSVYIHALRMAFLVLLLHVWDMEDYELEMFIEYAIFLNEKQQEEILDTTKELLMAGEIQLPYTIDVIRPFLNETMGEEEILERYFGLPIAGNALD